jgi:CelD/BcsL family acetyltransferase involved in cellulose biosynthesis
MANVFSSSALLEAAGATLYAGRRCQAASVTVEGQAFRLLSVDGSPQPSVPFFDFFEPSGERPEPPRRLGYLPAVSLESAPVAAWEAGAANGSAWSSPWVDWRAFPSFEAFEAQVAARHRKPFDSARKRRRLERERGPVRFEPDSRDQGLVRQCMEWKSRQYRRTGVVDLFSSERVVAFFRRLHDERLLQVSALFAGDAPVAIHLGCRFEERFYYWVPAYDEAAAAGSPGGLLLEALLEDSQRRGDREFDFLIGEEGYKFHYATDVRLVRPLGRPPLARRAWKGVRGALMPLVRRFGAPYRGLQALKRRAHEARLR